MTPEIAESIINITMTRGGGTFDHNGALIEREKGFVVGIHRGTWATMSLSDSDIAYGLFSDLLGEFGGVFIGTWYHKGEIYIDPVLITDNLDHAKELGVQNGQIAIYSFETGEIFL